MLPFEVLQSFWYLSLISKSRNIENRTTDMSRYHFTFVTLNVTWTFWTFFTNKQRNWGQKFENFEQKSLQWYNIGRHLGVAVYTEASVPDLLLSQARSYILNLCILPPGDTDHFKYLKIDRQTSLRLLLELQGLPHKSGLHSFWEPKLFECQRFWRSLA